MCANWFSCNPEEHDWQGKSVKQAALRNSYEFIVFLNSFLSRSLTGLSVRFVKAK